MPGRRCSGRGRCWPTRWKGSPPASTWWEWTASRFPGRPDEVTLRGSGWGNNPYCLRVSYRHGNPPDIGLDMVGFRCAADPRQGVSLGTAPLDRTIHGFIPGLARD